MATKAGAKPAVARPTTSSASSASSAAKAKDVGSKFKAMAAAAVAASVGAAPDSPSAADVDKGTGRAKVSRYVDPKVAARNSALNAMGGVKVDVFVRVRPKGAVDGDDPVLATVDKDNMKITLEDPAGHPAQYTYDKVYGMDATQEELYEDSVSPIIEQVCRGLSCAIFAYGQTGAGKTYTMRGDLSQDESKQGIIQRSIMHLFKRLQEHDYTDVKVSASFLEIYNEELEDLFVDRPKETPGAPKAPAKKPTATPAPSNKLMLVDDPERGCMCAGLTEVPVGTLEEVMKLLVDAEARCRFSETKMNKMSNRAHRIFTLIVNFKRYDNPVLSTLTFVDLAGSEDISKSGAKGLTAREASHINKSLLTLGRVINALACNEKHIPYRDSKLTRLLSEALGGVCKTSFIACISPCASSQTETNSTLRYAERAMEALNISQLPRWKQDEIMIDGLTRRVQQLLDELDTKDRIHFEEMTELKNDKLALQRENGELKKDLHHAQRKIARLLARKQQLKAGLHVVTQQREVLQAQREALQQELLETRSVRDGYLADRNAMFGVLSGVRGMRERLLKAHRETEADLTRDANNLKRTIEGAITDIDELHTELHRKKGLSNFNENLADNFKDRVSSKLRGIVQVVSEFKVAQDDAFSATSDMLASMRSSRQREAASLRSEVARLSSTVSGVLADIAQFSKETDAATKARLSRMRDTSAHNRDELEVAATKMRTLVVAKLEELRAQAATLDENLSLWSDKMKSKLDESMQSTGKFSKDVLGHLATVQAHLEGASAQQLAHLEEHSAALQKHADTEKATLTTEAERVITEISSFVQRLITDHTNQAVRRTEKAVANFQAAAGSIADETRALLAHQVSEHTAMGGRTNDWSAATTRSLEEGHKSNNAAHLTALGLLKKAVGASQAGETELNTGVGNLNTLATQHRDQHLQMCKEAEQASQAATTTTEGKVAKGTAELHADSEKIRDNVHGYAEKFEAASTQLLEHQTTNHDHVRRHVNAQTDDLFDTEADAVHYVMQEIKRDPKEPARRKDYLYPKNYRATDEYGAILKDVPADWGREVNIRDGKLQAGQGPDYPGQRGPADVSGLLTTTKPKPLPTQDQQTLDTAARDSDAGEYSSDGEHEDEANGGADGTDEVAC